MNRIKAVQQALDGRREAVYLEIGVAQGSAFRQISADVKIAVDPAFKISTRSRRLADSKGRVTHYFETTSDDFFTNQGALLGERGVDVALIDGLHSYEQALRDVENTLGYLREDGVIVMHDCNPKFASVACPASSYADFRAKNHWWNINWTGDVWKAIVNLRTFRDDVRVAVLDCDFGVGVVRKGRPDSKLFYSAEEIDGLSYLDLAADRKRLLNLTSPDHLGEILAPVPPKMGRS